MFWTIVLIVLALAFLAIVVLGFATDVPLVFAAIPLVLFLIVGFLTTFTTVEAKNVGVLTTFGKPSDRNLSAGAHLKAPWQKVTELDGTIQTDEYRGDEGCIYVRIGDGSRSCVTLTNRWQIVDEQADVIFGDYRSDDPTDSLRKAVVSTQLKAATQEVLAGYNPVAELEVVEGSNAAAASELSFAPDYGQISADIKKAMESRPGSDLITIEDITVSYVSLSPSTQGTIDDFIAAVGQTRIAAQQKSTAVERKAANDTLASSVTNDGVLVSRCLDIVEQAVEQGYPFNGAWSCLGAPDGVLVGSK